MATVQQIIEKAYTKVNGEFEAVVESSDDFKTYRNVLDQVVQQWAQTPYVKWQSLFNINYKLAKIVAADDFIYPVPDADTIHIGNTPLDGVYFVDEDDNFVAKFKLTDQAAYEASNATDIAVLVSDGLHLKTVPTKIVGCSIRLPVYVDPPSYANATAATVVRIDSVPWLIAEMAGFICDASPVPFIARNADKYHKEAQIFMKTMKADNRHRQHLVIKSLTGANNGLPNSLFDLLGFSGIIGGSSGSGVIDGGSA